jgi:two-component system, OmpR family, response regulator VicR
MSSTSKLPLRITIVNDDAAYLEMMSEVLRDVGYETTTFAGDITTAYREICTSPPDLLIVDLLFPESKQGADLLTLLWLTPATQHIPIVVCSAATHQLRSLANYLTQRGIEILFKPFDLVDLYRVVDRALSRPRYQRPASHGEEPPAHRPG